MDNTGRHSWVVLTLILAAIATYACSPVKSAQTALELTESETIVALKESRAGHHLCFDGLASNGESMAVASVSPDSELYRRGKYRVILRVSENDGAITYGSEFFENPEDALKFVRDKGVTTFRKCLQAKF